MPTVEARSPIRFLDISTAAADPAVNAIEDMYNGTLDVLILRQAFPPETMQAAGDRLDAGDGLPWDRPNQKSPVEDIRMLGTPATPTYIAPGGPTLDTYLDNAAWFRERAASIFGPSFDAIAQIHRMLGLVSGGRPVTLPVSADGRSYDPFTIRRLVDGTQIGLHHDYHYPLPLYDELRPLVDTTTLISWVVTVMSPVAGGELVVHPITPDEPNPPKMPNGWAWDMEAVEQRYPSARFVMGPGDAFLFASGRLLHRINRIAGPRARVTLGGFLALARDRGRVLYWS